MKRVAREANGWFPVGIPLTAVGPMFEQLKGMAQQVGRNPESLQLVVRGNLEFMASATSKERADFTGTPGQIATDFEAAKNLGANELVCDVQFSPGIETVEDILRRMEDVRTRQSRRSLLQPQPSCHNDISKIRRMKRQQFLTHYAHNRGIAGVSSVSNSLRITRTIEDR